jgi:hypothetical protein
VRVQIDGRAKTLEERDTSEQRYYETLDLRLFAQATEDFTHEDAHDGGKGCAS